MKRLLRSACALSGLALIIACETERTGPTGVRQATAALYPGVTGSYTGTGVLHLTSYGATYTITCPLTVDVPTQADSSFSGAFAVEATGDCSSRSGTVNGAVRPDGTLWFIADTPTPGANVFADAATETGCTLLSTAGSFSGSLSGSVISAAGQGVYDCPNSWGTYRVTADVSVSVTRS